MSETEGYFDHPAEESYPPERNEQEEYGEKI